MQINQLAAELEKGSVCKHFYDSEHRHGCYEEIRFIPDSSAVTIRKRHGYDAEEDMSEERFDGEWQCTLPKQSADGVLSELVRAGRAKLFSVEITEAYTWRKPYGNENIRSRTYRTDLEFTLEEDHLPVVTLGNPMEILNIGMAEQRQAENDAS